MFTADTHKTTLSRLELSITWLHM